MALILNPGSFRDPDGFIYSSGGRIFRQVNQSYQENYQLLMGSGLYENLTKDGLLVRHAEVEVESPEPALKHKILEPEKIPFISYPYEWCFSQFKDAALTTLEIQQRAGEYGLTLKDASAYNIQFYQGRPVFIDTLSFEKAVAGRPWVPYRQFCQHFLSPLALMVNTDIRLGQLLRVFLDGIPLDLASKMLGTKTRFNFSLLMHIHLHAKAQIKYSGNVSAKGEKQVSKMSALGLLDNLRAAVEKAQWRPDKTEWGDYYEETNYTDNSFARKKALVTEYLKGPNRGTVWDLGANEGVFSQIASDLGFSVCSFDLDPVAVEKNYLRCKKEGRPNLLPLILDLTNPSPGIGWANEERSSLIERGPADTIIALAVIHHLALSNNLPLPQVASFLARHCQRLIIEFVPKEDSQVQRLLKTRKDIFPSYHKSGFEKAFAKNFHLLKSQVIEGSERTLYLMESIQP